jgi:predicted AAA+ superfamily ATPase
MVIVDLIKHFQAKNLHSSLTFLRDSNKNEIDLIIERGGKTIPVEIKASETMASSFFKTLTWFQEQTHNNQKAVVVYGGNKSGERSSGRVISWKSLETI